MKTHELKCWPEHFKAIQSGDQTFDIRENDRDFKRGDKIVLREFTPCEECHGTGRTYDGYESSMCCNQPHGKFTGKRLLRTIGHILPGTEVAGLDVDYVVFSLLKDQRSK